MLDLRYFIFPLLGVCTFGFPPLWEEVPRSLEDYGKINGKINSSMAVDPWDYRQRLGTYRMLIEETEGAFKRFGPDNKMNVLWGLALQHGWQFKTKRLTDTGKEKLDSTCISPDSWWGCMNYYMSVVPFLSAAEAGYFNSLRYPVEFMDSPSRRFQQHSTDDIEGKSDISFRFCQTFVQCQQIAPKSTAAWKGFFQTLLSLDKSHKGGQGSHGVTLDQILALMWTAHTHSLNEARVIFTREFSLMTSEEALFCDSWVSLVHFIAAVRFETTYDNIIRFQDAFLPKRLLKEGDAPPFISDFTYLENRALYIMETSIWADNVTGGSLYALWKRAMCSGAGRAEGRHLLDVGLTTLSAVPGSLLRLSWILATHKCDN